MFRNKNYDDEINQFIRERVKTARLESGDTQEELAFKLSKNRVSVSDMERGRVTVPASDLTFIASLYEKPISYFFPPRVTINKDELSSLDEELLALFRQLPDQQKYITLEYVKQQVEISRKAFDRRLRDNS